MDVSTRTRLIFWKLWYWKVQLSYCNSFSYQFLQFLVAVMLGVGVHCSVDFMWIDWGKNHLVIVCAAVRWLYHFHLYSWKLFGFEFIIDFSGSIISFLHVVSRNLIWIFSVLTYSGFCVLSYGLWWCEAVNWYFLKRVCVQ